MGQLSIVPAAANSMAQQLYDLIFNADEGYNDAECRLIKSGGLVIGTVPLLLANASVVDSTVVMGLDPIQATEDATIIRLYLVNSSGLIVYSMLVATTADDHRHLVVPSDAIEEGQYLDISDGQLVVDCKYESPTGGPASVFNTTGDASDAVQHLFNAIYTDGTDPVDATLEYYEGTFPTNPNILPMDAVLLASVTSAEANSSIVDDDINVDAPNATVAVAGTVNYLRLVNSDSGVGIVALDVTATAGGGEIEFDSVAVAISDIVAVTSTILQINTNK